MSGIYIPNMEMPQSCTECQLMMNCDDCEGWECYCVASSKNIGYVNEVLTDKRRDDCPLVQVPDHGIIDREKMLDALRLELAMAEAVNDMEDYDAWSRTFDYARKFPTIIPPDPAEEAET